MQMKRSPRAARRGIRRGFTLIELLLVLVILAVLAAVVVPKLTGRVDMARRNSTIATISNLKTAIDTFEVDNGRLPTEQEGLLVLMVNPGGDLQNSWAGPYIQGGRLPMDGWGHDFTYTNPDKFTYDIISPGKNGVPGDDDDVTTDTTS
jgi:general secretion pathway protein G